MANALEGARDALGTIFYPRSVAVVGTTRVPGTVPYDIFANMLKDDFQGVLYPVSPKERFVCGVKAFKYVLDIPDPVDLAVIVFPSSVAHMALEQCGQHGVRSVIIISAGFKEVGPEGLKREQQLLEIAQKYSIRFIGPNCLGVINTDPASHLNASFARKMPEEGSIGFLSQSGALCTAVLDYAIAKHIGFSKFVSFGNKADVSDIDLMMHLKDDPKTKVILLYLEEINRGPEFLAAAQRVIREAKKPVLVLKSGRTQEGAAAAASHTGSLAGSDDVCDAALKQAGVIRCATIEEMFNTAIALTYQPLPRGNRVAIITNAGGPGVLTTDAAIAEKLKLAQFGPETTESFRRALPSTANIKNPVDVIGDARADRYRVALSGALGDSGVDGVFVILTPQSMTDIESIAREVCSIAAQSDKPLYTSFMGETDVAAGIDILQRSNIPHYILPESMCKSYARAWHFRTQSEIPLDEISRPPGLDTERVRAIVQGARAAGRSYLPSVDSFNVLKAYGLPMTNFGLARSADEAVAIAESIGYPVVMKIESDQIIHKSDIGGVVVNVGSAADVRTVYDAISAKARAAHPNAVISGIFIQAMIKGGVEVILGMKQDRSFGPVLMFGLGGVFVEIFHDVSFRVAPIGHTGALGMVDEIRAAEILRGARGTAPRDRHTLADALSRLSLLATDIPEISELDINPMIVLDEGKGCFMADARIILTTQ